MPIRRPLALTVLTLPCLANAAPQAPSATELMDWAQAQYTHLFPGALTDTTIAPYTFRGPYSTGNYMGVDGNHTVYLLGPASGGQLQALGTLNDFACLTKPASCQTSDAPTLLQTYLNQLDSLYASAANAIPGMTQMLDGCYMNNGYSKSAEIAQLSQDEQALARANRLVGSVRRNPQVLSEQHKINTDGSARRELTVSYEVVLANGFTYTHTEQLVHGSTAGTRWPTGACATPQSAASLRLLGNQRVVGASVTAASYLLDRYKLADGTAQTSGARQYRSEIRFNVTDPANVATYATISGPGIIGTYKLVSPRLLRSAPEFAGKVGHFVDWPDTDTFKACRNPSDSNYADAAVADCTTHGASSNVWRASHADPFTVDTNFAAFGFVANGEYTLKIYNDDGWKTVNGQANKIPLTTYTTRLRRLPASAATLATGGSTSSYPEATLSLGMTDLATLLRTKGQGTISATRTNEAMVDSKRLYWTNLYAFLQGRTAASTTSNFYPASRHNPGTTPTTGASSVTLSTGTPPTAMTVPSYGEIGLVWDSFDGLSVRRLITFE